MGEFIEVQESDFRNLIKEAYNLSMPKGMGFIHFEEGGLDDSYVDEILNQGDDHCLVSMDYIKGRCCKFNIFNLDGKFVIRSDWRDHSDSDMDELLERVGIER